MTHEITLTGYQAQHAEDSLLSLGTADSYGTETLHITADDAWAGLTITATFVRDLDRTRVLADQDGYITVPQEATSLDGGGFLGRIVFAGVKNGMQRISTDLMYRITPHASAEGSESAPTPAAWEQFIAAVKADRDAAETAAKNAEKIGDRYGALADETENMETLLGYTRGTGSTSTMTPDNIYTGRYIANDGTLPSLSDTNFVVKEFSVKAGRSYRLYSPQATQLMGDFPIAAFKTTAGTSGTCTVLKQGSTVATDYNFTYVPAEDGCIFIAGHMNFYSLRIDETVETGMKLERIDALEKKAGKTLWSGRKIVWIGTSVPFGQYAQKSYAQEAADALGATLVNASVPGLAIHTAADGSSLTYGSLCLSKSEYAAAGVTIPDAPIAYTPGGAYNDFYRTYENVFSEENSDADLYVFDVAPNNERWGTADWDAFDFSNWAYTDGTAFSAHRTTFLGALLFLLDKLYAVNPNARVALLLGSSFAYEAGKAAFELLHAKWNIPVIDLWGKVNTSPKSLAKLKAQDGTDPHPSTFAHEVMGRMLAGELTLIG